MKESLKSGWTNMKWMLYKADTFFRNIAFKITLTKADRGKKFKNKKNN